MSQSGDGKQKEILKLFIFNLNELIVVECIEIFLYLLLFQTRTVPKDYLV